MDSQFVAMRASYNSEKRFAGKMCAVAPGYFDRLEFVPGEDAQVGYGVGAPTNAGSGDVQETPFIGDDDIGEENKPRGFPLKNERNMRAAKCEE